MTLRNDRDALPAEYQELDFRGRLQYVENVRTEALQLRELLQQMREKAPQNPLVTAALQPSIRVPSLPRLKPKVSRSLRYHRTKIFDLQTLSQGSAAHPSVATVAQDCMVVLWDVQSGLKYETFPVSRGHISCLAVSPTGRVTTAAGLACTVDVYATTRTLNELLSDPIEPFKFDLDSNGQPPSFPYVDNATVAETSTDSETIASSVDGFGGVTGWLPGEPSAPPSPEKPVPTQLTELSPLEAMKEPTGWGSERVEQYVMTLSGGHDSCIMCQKFATDSSLLSASGTSIMHWDVATGRAVTQYTGGLNGCTWIDTAPLDNSSGVLGPQQFASSASDSSLRLWDFREEDAVQQFFGPENRGGFEQVQIMPDGKTLLAIDTYGLSLYDMRTNSLLQYYQAARDTPKLFAVSKSGRLAITGHEDGSITVLDLLRAEYLALMVSHKDNITGISVLEDQVLSSSFDGTVKMWSLDPFPNRK